MKTIDKNTMKTIVKEIKLTAHNHEDVRSIVNSRINLCDLIPAELADVTLKIVKLMYKPTDKGRNGKHEEAIDHVYNLIDCNGAEAVPFREFFAHKHGKADLIDRSVGKSYEKKTGTGDWLYCEEDDFDTCIRMYRRKRTLIRWDYVRADKGIDIHIETTYKNLFEYLIAYNPEKGLSTWFVKSSRTHSDGLNEEFIWKMQEISTSKKKIAYLNGWKG